ncbi:hypothetical protein ABW20_dc0106171 [Dactylellina cionopaga]|nr:hypothetical protein ABW20_dc0106171 [Dactylellina cionopaga]
MFRNIQSSQTTAPQPRTSGWPSTLDMSLFGQGIRKRAAPYEDSDQEEDDDGQTAFGVKKLRTVHSSEIVTDPFSSSHPSHPANVMNAFISPPVTPTPLARRQASDIAMEDLDMADSQPSSQREWATSLQVDVNIPSFVQQESNLSAISMLDADEEAIQRPHTPGIIMNDMNRLEVSPSSEIQSRGWMGMAKLDHSRQEAAVQQQTQQQQVGEAVGLATAASKGRFTMGYRADCEKCRNRIPGHWAHPPTF